MSPYPWPQQIPESSDKIWHSLTPSSLGGEHYCTPKDLSAQRSGSPPTPVLGALLTWPPLQLVATWPTYLGHLGKLPKAGVPDAGDIQEFHLLGGAEKGHW